MPVTTVERTEQSAQSKLPDRYASALGLSFIIAAVFTYGWRNLGNRYFWSDEASSLYTSLGWPEIGEGSRGIAEAWTASQTHIEPGLFNMLEYLWAVGIGTQIEVLRTLPFLFFVTYIVAILILSRFVNAPWYVGSAIVGLMFLENITPYYGVELRPHIAGLSAAVVLPLLAIWLTRKPTAPRFSGFLVGFMFFGSFQYTSYPIQVAIAGVLVLSTLMAKETVQRALLWAAAAFATLWLPVTFILIRGNPFGLAGGGAIHAIPEAFFPNLSFGEILSIVSTNMLSPTGLPRTIFMVLIPVLWVLSRFPRPLRPSNQAVWTVIALWITVTVATGISFALAMLGFMPWILGTRWSIADVGLIALSLVGLAGLVMRIKHVRLPTLRLVIIGGSLLLALAGSFRLATYERTPGNDWSSVFGLIVGAPQGKTVIDNWTYPEVRYWIELSGQYDGFQRAWQRLEPTIAGPLDKATPEDVERFLMSNDEYLLIRSPSLLEGIQLPLGTQVIGVPVDEEASKSPSDGPVLVVNSKPS